MALYAGIGGVVKEIKRLYDGVDGVVKEIKKLHAGIGGVAKEIFSSGFADGFNILIWVQTGSTTEQYNNTTYGNVTIGDTVVCWARRRASSYGASFAGINKYIDLTPYSQITIIVDISGSYGSSSWNNYFRGFMAAITTANTPHDAYHVIRLLQGTNGTNVTVTLNVSSYSGGYYLLLGTQANSLTDDGTCTSTIKSITFS